MRRIGLVFSAALFFFSAAALADETVELKNGTTYRGELVEKVPGDHLTIKLATNEVKTIPWSELKSAPGGTSGPGVQVSVESDHDNTTLYRLSAAGVGVGSANGQTVVVGYEQYEPMCTAPCRVAADPEQTYVIGGDGVTGSDKFRLPRQPDVGLRVEGGSTAKRGGGVALFLVGVPAAVVGATFLILGAATSPDPTSDKYVGPDAYGNYDSDAGRASTFRTIGFVSLGVGAAMIAGGIALIVTSQTKVTTSSGERVAKLEVPLGHGLSLGPKGISF